MSDSTGEAIRASVADYHRVFPPPCDLAPNLGLAVDALAERDASLATLARVQHLLDEAIRLDFLIRPDELATALEAPA